MLSMVLEEKQRTLQDHRRKPTLTFEGKEEFCWRHDTSAKTYRISEPAGKSRGKKALLAGQRF